MCLATEELFVDEILENQNAPTRGRTDHISTKNSQNTTNLEQRHALGRVHTRDIPR